MPDIETKIKNYSPLPQSIDELAGLKLVFLVGITGVGKNTIVDLLLKTGYYQNIISHTTRPLRENDGVLEVDGVDYYFVDMPKIDKMVDNHEFLELKFNHGKIYGTSLMSLAKVRDSSKIGITDIDVQGVEEYMQIMPKFVTPIFVLPPDYETWQERFASRYAESGGIDDNEKRVRLQTAEAELEEALRQNYFEFVINDDLTKVAKVVDEIAHGHKSTQKNAEAKLIAEKLLVKLRQEIS